MDFSMAVVAGVAIAGGYWLALMWRNFDNPVYPYFNNYLHSPWWLDQAVPKFYGPKSLLDWLVFPLRYLQTNASFVGEVYFRDWRIPVVFMLGIAIALRHVWQRSRSSSGNSQSQFLDSAIADKWGFVAVFWFATFLVWAAQHSIERYIVTLELLTGALIVGGVRALVPRAALPWAAIMIAAITVASTVYPDYARVQFGPHWFEVRVPPVSPRALVMLNADAPMSYVLPFFPADARFVGINNNLNDPALGPDTKMIGRARQIVQAHDGPLYLLTNAVESEADASSAYKVRRLEETFYNVFIQKETCREISTNMLAISMLLCQAHRGKAD
jgi:hypothetical protein